MYDFILPDIGEGISEALLINWSVEPGQQVDEGDEIATVSTDKVDVELPAPRAGTVAELCWKPGDTIKVGSVFMRIDTGEHTTVRSDENAARPEEMTTKPAPEASPPLAKSAKADGIVAAPSTRKLASDFGVDLNTVNGSGTGGRILREDVERQRSGDHQGAEGIRREPLNRVRAVMAERMAKSVQTLAHSTMNFEIRAERLSHVLNALRPEADERGIKLSVTALLVKCLGKPLRQNPRFNATIDEQSRELLLLANVNLGVAMATEQGLMVPVIKGVNNLPLLELAHQLNDLVARTRTGRLDPSEMSKGTFTLSNTGALERATILSTRPVINAPQTATLWVSKIQNRPVVDGDKLSVGSVMNASLSFDHRFIDGADALSFINDLVEMIEAPERVLV